MNVPSLESVLIFCFLLVIERVTLQKEQTCDYIILLKNYQHIICQISRQCQSNKIGNVISGNGTFENSENVDANNAIKTENLMVNITALSRTLNKNIMRRSIVPTGQEISV